MTEIRHFAGWLRSLAGLVAVAGVLALSGCGGGSGAPNNFFESTLTVLPASAVSYSGIPTVLTITGGTGPFRATSSNSAVLPVAQDVAGRTIVLLARNVEADNDVTITVQDLGPLTPVAPSQNVLVTVRPAPLLNSLTITPSLDDCGTAVCSGQTAIAKVTVFGPGGGSIGGDPVRFDVIGTAYKIVSNNPAQPLVTSLTVLSDSTGSASVILQVNANVSSQVAQLSATDITSGQQLIGNFTIQQFTDGSTVMTVVPDTATIKGAFQGVCSNGFRIAYFIYGGTPPYRVTSTFPGSVTLVNSIVNTNGGSFEAITNGACVDPLVFSIVDATGLQTTAELHNIEGTEQPPIVIPAVAISPPSFTNAACTGATFNFVISGGLAPFNVVSAGGIVTPNPVATSPGSVAVSGFTTGSGAHQVFVGDSSIPQKTANATITCS